MKSGKIRPVKPSRRGSLHEEILAAFGNRYAFNAIGYGGVLLLVGGVSSNINQNDTWASLDGVTWKKGYNMTFDFSQH